MSFFRRYRFTRAAREDAAVEADSAEERIIAELGPRPVLEPMKNHLHAQMVRRFNQGTALQVTAEELRNLESERARYSSTIGLGTALCFAFVVEVIGAYQVMKAFDLSFGERLSLGTAMAAALFSATAVFVGIVGGRGHSEGRTAGMGRPISLLIPLCYALFIGALAVARLREADEELSRLAQYSEAIIMVAASVGPAFWSHSLLLRWVPLRRLNREIALTQRQFRKGEGERSKAEQFLMQFSARQLAWDGAAARLRALYRTQHRLRIHESKLLPATTVEGDNDEET